MDVAGYELEWSVPEVSGIKIMAISMEIYNLDSRALICTFGSASLFFSAVQCKRVDEKNNITLLRYSVFGRRLRNLVVMLARFCKA